VVARRRDRDGEPVFSPDGRWLAYISTEAGNADVYVRKFPEGAPAFRISTGGANQIAWSPDGRQLFWTQNTDTAGARLVWVADVDSSSAGFLRGQPRQLFETDWLQPTIPVGSFDVSPDGRRFLGVQALASEPGPVTRIEIVENWLDELKRLVPTK
jgi:eukaryotic-like serine/threonine-protein kinase